MKTVRLTILSSLITLLLLTYPTYWILEQCHPECTPRFTHRFMDRIEDGRQRGQQQWESPMDRDFGPFFGLPTLTPRP